MANSIQFMQAVNKTFGVFFNEEGEQWFVTHDGFRDGEYSSLYYILAPSETNRHYTWNEITGEVNAREDFDTTWGDNRTELEATLNHIAKIGADLIKGKLGIN